MYWGLCITKYCCVCAVYMFGFAFFSFLLYFFVFIIRVYKTLSVIHELIVKQNKK